MRWGVHRSGYVLLTFLWCRSCSVNCILCRLFGELWWAPNTIIVGLPPPPRHAIKSLALSFIITLCYCPNKGFKNLSHISDFYSKIKTIFNSDTQLSLNYLYCEYLQREDKESCLLSAVQPSVALIHSRQIRSEIEKWRCEWQRFSLEEKWRLIARSKFAPFIGLPPFYLDLNALNKW